MSNKVIQLTGDKSTGNAVAQSRPASFFKPAIQPRLAVGQPNDPYEREADAMADKVMRMPAPGTGPSPFFTHTISRLQRKCAHCEEEEKLQRKEMNGEETTSDDALESYVGKLGSSGAALPDTVRSYYEPRFNYDFSHVKVHTDTVAAKSAQSINALAFTSGSNIVFNSGQYNPDTQEGKRLMGHELTHVIQQDEGNGVHQVQKFGSTEHVTIGNNAIPAADQQVSIFGYGRVSFGELIAMTGDYFESLSQMQDLAHQGQFGREQIDYVRWKVNGSSGPAPTVGAGVVAAVDARYDALAGQNEMHFSTGALGRNNRDMYITLHTQAIRAAFLAGASPLTVQPFWPESLEASADHFLTDAFSAGHVRTPRGQVKQYWNNMYPNFTDNLIQLISCFMAAYIKDVDNHYIAPVALIITRVEPVVRALAGNRLNNYSIGDLLSLAMHDADNAGLDVVSQATPPGSTGATPFHWRAIGDDNLYRTIDPANTAMVTAQQQTQRMVEGAVHLSYLEVEQARHPGSGVTLTSMIDPANFRALSLIPSEDTSSTTNPVFSWRAANIRALPANLQAVLAAQFATGTTVFNTLNSIAAPRCTGENHSGTAWECFKSRLLADPFGMIANACEGNTCPPGNNNPCSTMAAGAACP